MEGGSYLDFAGFALRTAVPGVGMLPVSSFASGLHRSRRRSEIGLGLRGRRAEWSESTDLSSRAEALKGTLKLR